MKFGCCAPPERMEAVRRAGFDYAETTVARTLKPLEPESEFAPVRRRIQDAGIPVEAFNVFLPAEVPVVGDAVDRNRLDGYLDTAIARMEEFGGRIVVFGSGGARSTPEGFDRKRAADQIIEFLSHVGPKLDRAGITLAIEPLFKPASDQINTVGEGVAAARRANHPRVTVLADLFHMVHENDPFTALGEAGGLLRHVHVPVPPLEGKELRPWDYVYPQFLTSLSETGYDHRISVEDNGGRFEDFETEAGLALAYLKDKWGT